MKYSKFIIAFILIFLALMNYCAIGQEESKRFEAEAEVSHFHGTGLSLHYYYNEKSMLGVGVRTCFWIFENHRDIHFENTMHFGKLNKQNVGGWYFNQQLVFWHYSHDRYKDIWAITLGLTLGKTIAFTKRLGLNIDAGLGINHILLAIVDENAFYQPTNYPFLLPLFINLNLGLAYKF